MEMINDHFQNFKRYQIPRAQLVIADIPYNIGKDACGPALAPRCSSEGHCTAGASSC